MLLSFRIIKKCYSFNNLSFNYLIFSVKNSRFVRVKSKIKKIVFIFVQQD